MGSNILESIRRLYKSFRFGIIIFIISVFFFSCANIDEFNETGESYYMPDVDIFIVMGPLSGSTLGVERFNVNDGTPAEYFNKIMTSNGETGMNYWMSMLGIAFYQSTIRIFYIKYDALNYNTQIQTMSNEASFTLTDFGGLNDKGTVYNEEGPLKIFVIGDTNPSAPYVGIGWVGARGLLTVYNNVYMNSTEFFSKLITHELGHNFNLQHPFGDDGGPNPDSCAPAVEGTTNRIMDYTNNDETFVSCERLIAELHAKFRYLYEKRFRDYDSGPTIKLYTGDWSGQITVGTAGSTHQVSTSVPLVTDPLIRR